MTDMLTDKQVVSKSGVWFSLLGPGAFRDPVAYPLATVAAFDDMPGVFFLPTKVRVLELFQKRLDLRVTPP